MLIVSLEDNMHDTLNPILNKNWKINVMLSSAELA